MARWLDSGRRRNRRCNNGEKSYRFHIGAAADWACDALPIPPRRCAWQARRLIESPITITVVGGFSFSFPL